ncbi:MAG: Rqc2 family fibronectin-binding protein [Candidatus Bipolaricaulota bacterium]
MGFNGITLHVCTLEIKRLLKRGVVRKIYQPENHLITLNFWTGEKRQMLISTGESLRIQISELDFENPSPPPPFSMLLRKHLSGTRLVSAEQRGLDRVIELKFGRKSRECDQKPDQTTDLKSLVVELMGRNSNAILLDQQRQILGVLHSKEGPRELTVNNRYQFPPRQDKVDLRKITEPQLLERLPRGELENPLWRYVMNAVEGIGPLMAKEIVYSADLEPDSRMLQRADRSALWNSVDYFRDRLNKEEFQPVVYLTGGRPTEFSPWELSLIDEDEFCTYPTMSEALDFYFSREQKLSAYEELESELKSRIRQELERLTGAKENVRKELDRAKNREELKKTGDLILSNLSRLEKGQKTAELPDPYKDNERRKIELDPSLTPQENAEQYYTRYKKLKRGHEKMEKRLKQLNRQENHLRELEKTLKGLESEERLKDLKGRMKELGFWEEEDSSPEHQRRGPRVYNIEGYQLKVGKNSKQNDKLVREAAKGHLWFHVRDYPGAHAVLVTNGKPDQIPSSVLRKAARIAAYHSKARKSDKVLVSYTQIKYVEKPKGAKPGLVRISNEDTIAVNPSEVNT